MRNSSNHTVVLSMIAVTTMTLLGCASGAAQSGGASRSTPIENPGEITLPKTFQSVWYRPEERGVSLIAYSASGTLVVGEDALDFRADGTSLRIPISSVRTIAWGKVGVDFVNDWAVVEYDATGTSRRVYFKDGSSLGHGGDSDLIYATIKYAAVIRGGVKPNPESFHSGWVTAHGGGGIGMEGKLALVISLRSKAPVPIWTRVTFSNPAPSESCEETVLLSPGEKKAFRCPQDKILPDSVYSILIDVSLDEGRQNLVDRNLLTQKWDQATAKAIHEAVAKTALGSNN